MRNDTNLVDKLALLWGTGLGTGFSPIVPGTVGSLVGVLFYLILHFLVFVWFGFGFVPGILLYTAVTVALFLLGVAAAYRMEKWYAEKDPSQVVADEVVGYLVAAGGIAPSPLAVALTFVLFRIFDIIKPFPARRSENLPGGWGVMVDDLWAGLYANLATRVILYLWN